jgi:hypothetical protein
MVWYDKRAGCYDYKPTDFYLAVTECDSTLEDTVSLAYNTVSIWNFKQTFQGVYPPYVFRQLFETS